jgi:hypothetical protein
MGQYHHPVCIEAEEGLDPAGMDSGLKEGEQGFNRPSTPPRSSHSFVHAVAICRQTVRSRR